MTDKIVAHFKGYISSKRSAIGVDGMDGGSVTLEFSNSDIAEALKLVAMRGKVLQITIEEIEERKPKVVHKKVKSKSTKEKTSIVD